MATVLETGGERDRETFEKIGHFGDSVTAQCFIFESVCVCKPQCLSSGNVPGRNGSNVHLKSKWVFLTGGGQQKAEEVPLFHSMI